MSRGGSEAAMSCSGDDSDSSRTNQADLAGTLRDVHFVSIVRGYEELYLLEHPRYADRAHRRRVWDEIGTIMNQPPEDCRKRWLLIRQNYDRSLKRANSRGPVDDKYWTARPAHERVMTFLNRPHVNRTEAPDSESEQSNDPDDIILTEDEHGASDSSGREDEQGPSRTRSSGAASPAPQEPPTQLAPHLEQDDTVQFFAELGESIKDFPEGVRINVKREVFKIVIDAEERLYHKKLRDELHAQMND